MKIDIENLPDSPDSLKEIISQLTKQLGDSQQKCDDYKNKYEQLIEALRLAKQRHFEPSSEKNLQADLFDEAGVELPEAVKEILESDQNEEIEVAAHKRKKHPVRTTLPEFLPREVVLHDLKDEEKICSCGENLVRIGEEISEQLKYIPAQLSVVQHVRPKYACKPCEENVKIASMPVLLLPKSIATPELISHIIVAKYCDHIPLYRQESIWARLDIAMPRSSLCGWLLKTAEICAPLIELLRKMIIAYNYAQADETTLQVLGEKDRKNTTKSYMWCYRGGGEKPSVVYEYQETRSGLHAQNFLAEFKGYLQSDAYSGYLWANDDKNIVRVGCHAHARRPFAELVKLSKNGLAEEAVRFYRKLYAIEKEARENNLSYEQRNLLRNEKSKPILDAFKKWLDHNLVKTSEHGKIGKSIRYCLSNWTELTNYLKDGRIEIDNNFLENAIRPFALGRKNWLFSGSPEGAKAGAIFYSLIQTCKANQIEPYQYFCSMLNQIRECQSEEDFKKLLPQFIEL